MASTREILTFQFGNYANYIGSHWWNIQEFGFNYDPTAPPSEIDHDILYREGVDFKGQTTYTPRLLLLDLQGALNHLPEEGLLDGYVANSLLNYAEKNSVEKVKEKIPWDKSNIEVIQKEPVKKPEFQIDIDDPEVDVYSKQYDLKENVKTWPDFLYTRYHPRSFNVIKNYKLSSEKETFDSFSNGQRMWETEMFESEFIDKIRQYVEECNNCQGFQTIFDCTNGFSGLSLSCLQHLNDEYSKTNFAIPVFSPKSILFENADEAMTSSIRIANIALTYSKLIEQSSMFLPLSTIDKNYGRNLGESRKFPLINYDETNLYHTSAILASYLDTLTLRYRLKDHINSISLPGLCLDLTNYGRKMTAAAFSFPFPMRYDQDLIECLDKFDEQMFTQLSPNCQIGTDYIVQSVSVRGIPKNRLKKPLKLAQTQMKMSAYKCESISEMFQLYFQCQNHASLAHVSSIQSSLKIQPPYPLEIFDTRLTLDGFLKDTKDDEKIKSIPAVASIQCSGDLADTIETLHREASRINISKLHRFKETGLETDEYSEMLETLLQFKDHYEDNFEL